MTLVIIIFFVAIFGAFGMLLFRSWEIRTDKITIEGKETYTPELSFRYFEKVCLHTAKHIIQWVVLSSVKVWFIIVTKIKILFKNKLPKINKLFKKETTSDPKRISFVQRAIIESKVKIKRVKENIKKEHEDNLPENTEIKGEVSDIDKTI